MAIVDKTQFGQPQFSPGDRVAKKGEPHSGRVQAVSYDQGAKTFRYMVKWDGGPSTLHLETELVYEPLPPHYP